ncbi:ATP-binding protein [Halomonas qaidamensis]|uniref:ATP-binding protein n=1 Tax=Halomonas qaidamensis TaxID=2866211 RepID=A0ABY6JJL8_9GAMM|nr:ATP-binding protein [Halomonas qaidamensis]UYV17622.1 ATP-binding protein [Halomonas qaidamensis]
MKLKRFRVTNFRSVTDSGWIDASDVTALIGENESGKTNLLLPLWKLNPSGGGEISPLDDMPRSRFAEMRKEPERHDFIRCIFELDDAERDLAAKFGIDRNKTETVEVVKDFASRYLWRFSEEPGVNLNNVYEQLDCPEAQDNEEESDAEKDLGPSLHETLSRWLPKFVYYSNYGNLDAQIYLPHVVDNLGRDELGDKEAAKARTLKVLFKLVDLGPEEVLELGRATVVTERVNPQGRAVSVSEKTEAQIQIDDEQLRTRAALLQSASSTLTRSFKDWWKQGDYKFRLHADGYYFRIWVSDDRRPDEIELEHRSTGLQWFLSFFLVFKYESEDTHENAIVLLDEPGHSLHPLAQRDLSAFFDSLSETHQIFFTTHSPFMIDANRLDRVRKVHLDDDGATVASSNLAAGQGKKNDRGAGASYAVHSALNLTVAESLLLGCSPVIVEGPSDQHYLSAIKTILISKGKIQPVGELVFPPSGGAKTAKIIAGILMGRDDTLPFVLLDGDTAGKQAVKSLVEGLYQGSEDRVLSTDEFIDGITNTEIEDLLPAELIVQVMDRIERRAERDFEDVYETGKPIVPQIKNWAKTEGVELRHDWKVQLALGVKTKLLANPDKHIDEKCLSNWVNLFERLA